MRKISLLLFTALAFAACKKDDPQPTPPSSASLNSAILTDVSQNVVQSTYNDLHSKALQLQASILAFQTSSTDPNLSTCKQYWRDARSAWEQSEGFLFGPVSSENVDPRIDTWPVNFTDLDSVLSSSAVFTAGYIDSLEDALKGFHPIEYLLFGQNGNKTASQMTAREMEYLIALSNNLEVLTNQVSGRWNPSSANNYNTQFVTAGSGSTAYSTQRAAYEEMVNAMAGICDEVANGKISEPFLQQDPSLEESPFAFNSITDFTNNIRSVENVYLGRYSADGKGIEDLVRTYNLSLDGDIKQKIAAAIASLNSVTVPFGQAITQQPVQLQNAINAINNLKDAIENDLLPFVQQHTN